MPEPAAFAKRRGVSDDLLPVDGEERRDEAGFVALLAGQYEPVEPGQPAAADASTVTRSSRG